MVFIFISITLFLISFALLTKNYALEKQFENLLIKMEKRRIQNTGFLHSENLDPVKEDWQIQIRTIENRLLNHILEGYSIPIRKDLFEIEKTPKNK